MRLAVAHAVDDLQPRIQALVQSAVNEAMLQVLERIETCIETSLERQFRALAGDRAKSVNLLTQQEAVHFNMFDDSLREPQVGEPAPSEISLEASAQNEDSEGGALGLYPFCCWRFLGEGS